MKCCLQVSIGKHGRGYKHIILFPSMPYERSITSSKASSLHARSSFSFFNFIPQYALRKIHHVFQSEFSTRAIQFFLLQFLVSSRFVKFIQQLLTSFSLSSCHLYPSFYLPFSKVFQKGVPTRDMANPVCLPFTVGRVFQYSLTLRNTCLFLTFEIISERSDVNIIFTQATKSSQKNKSNQRYMCKKNCALQQNSLGFLPIVSFCVINSLNPNDPYRGRTAPLTSKRCIIYIYNIYIYIYIQQIQVLNILNIGIYSPFFFVSSKCSLFQNSNLFGSCIIHILYTGCAKIKKIIPAPKG